MTRRYIAQYKCAKCGKEMTVSVGACDYHMALVKLPRWIWPDNHRMRRQGGATIEDDNK